MSETPETKMMEVENSLAEKFISELPDDLSEARVIAEVRFLFEFESWARILKLLRSPRIDSKEPIPPGSVAWARIFKRLRSPRIDSKEPIPPGWNF